MRLEPDTLVGGDFRVVSRLREGGMGSVWIAEQVSVGRKRALKLMRSDIAHDERLRERFVQEARVGATIDSDHVVEVVAAGIDDKLDAPWLAMELLDGRDLGAVIADRGPLPRVEVGEIVAQLCHALAAAHAVGVIHRDLKPENIFLARARRRGGERFEVKVLDFGIAKVAADAQSSGGGSGILGTPLYMAPEQADASAGATPAIDVWALGLIVYRMLTARFFWRCATSGTPSLAAILRELLFDPIPLASVRAAEEGLVGVLPEAFDAWFARCLDREPEARFSDARAAFEALAPVLGVSAEPSPIARIDGLSMAPATGAQLNTLPSPGVSRGVAAVAAAEAVTVTSVHEDSKFRVGRVSDILVIRWLATPTTTAVAVMDRVLARLIRDVGGRESLVMPVVDTGTPAPNADARDALKRSMEQHDAGIRAVAYVLLGEGFQAAALRGVITSLMLAARMRQTTKVFATFGEAVDWFETRRQTPTSERATDLVAGLDRFCRR